MRTYLDNAATTKVCSEALQVITKVMEEDYGNPSSLHRMGVEAEKYIRSAKETFARLLKVDSQEIIFTSGGTESNNMALFGAAAANHRRGKHIISTSIEHASVYNPLMALEKEGYEVTYLPVDNKGLVDLDVLEKSLRDDTILVSIMCVNNEIGTIEPLDKIGKIIKKFNENIVFHVDAIQGFGKMNIYPSKLNIDMLSISGHKFHGPKGCGVLYMRRKTKCHPLILGGGQQKDMRSGTENVPGIAGIAKAAEIIYTELDLKIEKMYQLRETFIEQLETIDGVFINGFKQPEDMGFSKGCSPHIVSASFENIRAEVLLHALEDKGVFVSSGSACASNHPAISGTLKAIGTNKAYLDATVRFSFGSDTTSEDIQNCITALKEIVPVLRRYRPGGRS